MEKRAKSIETQRLEAVIEDMKLQLEEMKKISKPERFIDKFNAFFRHSAIAKVMLQQIELKHIAKQTNILEGKYDNKLRTTLTN